MSKFLGEVDQNTILRGEVAAEIGDTFVSQALDTGRYAAFKFLGKSDVKPAYKQLQTLGTGMWETCEAAARRSL